MPYSVDRFQASELDFGRFPVLVEDNSVNKAVCPLKIVGKGVPNYGEHIAENLVWMLENFAGTNQPANPLTGQLWYQTDGKGGQGTMRMWDGNTWRPMTTLGYGNEFPKYPVPGDIFYRRDEGRLYFYQESKWQIVGSAQTTELEPSTGKAGELWYNQKESRLYAYNEKTGWQVVGPGSRVSATEPSNIGSGDLWFNTTTNTLSYYETDQRRWKKLTTFRSGELLPGGAREGEIFWNTENEKLYYKTSDDWVEIGPDKHVQVADIPPTDSPGIGYFWVDSTTNLQYYWDGSRWKLPTVVYNFQPSSPIFGDLFYDEGPGRLFIWDGNEWDWFTTTKEQDSPPTNTRVGDFWFDTVSKHLKFWDGSEWTFVAYDSSEDTLTKNIELSDGTNTYKVRGIYTNDTLVGVFSNNNINPVSPPFDTLFSNGVVTGLTLVDGFKLNDSAVENLIDNKINSALSNFDQYPISMVPFPEVFTSSKQLTVNAVTTFTGGRVSLTPGEKFSMAYGDAATGVVGIDVYETTGFVSPDLDTSSTYFLRVKIDSGSPVFYVQKGTISDGLPISLKGIENGSTGGGFDSTKLDMVIAKVETGIVGSLPVVTKYKNSDKLFASQTTNELVYGSSANVWTPATPLTLNWARTPNLSEVTLDGFRIDSTASDPTNFLTSVVPGGDQLLKAGVKKDSVTREEIIPVTNYQDLTASAGLFIVRIFAQV